MTPDQEAELLKAAIPLAKAGDLGIRSAKGVSDLPDHARWIAGVEGGLPALVFHWQGLNGRHVEQVKPLVPMVWDDERHKYLWPKGEPPITHVARKGTCGVLIVEGTKQSRCAALYVPGDWTVLGLGGCHNWMQEGFSDPELGEHVDDQDVVILLDADIRGNVAVWTAGERLRDALMVEGARSVKFALLPYSGSNPEMGLDDFLGSKPEARRGRVLANLIDLAGQLRATDRPSAKRTTVDRSAGRPVYDVDTDTLEFSNILTGLLKDAYDGTVLFEYGGVLVKVVGDETDPSIDRWFDEMLASVAGFIQVDVRGRERVGWPGRPVINIIKNRADHYTRLTGIATTPFLRHDGSVCSDPGYDSESGILLTGGVAVTVPEHPTRAEIRAAVSVLLDDMLGDFPLEGPEAKANVLGLFLTPVVREFVKLAPLAVVNGLQAGVGKGKIASCLSIILWGHDTELLPWNDGDNAELRKTLTGAFKTSTNAIMFDEAHHLSGAALAQALTAASWTDRELGTNKIGKFPNRLTWLSLGNNVTFSGDVKRRIYQIRLWSDDPDPENRTGFKHDDLEQWVADNRERLLSALLTLARAWHDRGQPFSGTVDFGSYEQWQRTIGGILEVAEVPGFLATRKEWSKSNDREFLLWKSHLINLAEVFGNKEFQAREVGKQIVARRVEELPPGISGESKDLPKRLGEAYLRVADRWFDGYRVVKVGRDQRHVAIWRVETMGTWGPMGTSPTFARSEACTCTGRCTCAAEGGGRRGPHGSPCPHTL